MKVIDLTGKRFGKLTVISRAENDKHGKARFLCRCDCKNTCVVLGKSLRSGHTKSCGCLKNEMTKEKHPRFMHGMRNSSIFHAWSTMKQRCLNPATEKFKRYGGRGITVFPEWVHSFQAFYEYVSKLEHFGEPNYSLDRINNDGNYEPGNLRWADKKTQRRNQSRIHFVEYNGKLMSLSEAAELSGILRDTLKGRANRGDTGEKLFRPTKLSSRKS